MSRTREVATRVVLDTFKSKSWSNDDLINAVDSALQHREREVRAEIASIVQDSDFGEIHKTVQRKLADVIRRDDTPQEGEQSK